MRPSTALGTSASSSLPASASIFIRATSSTRTCSRMPGTSRRISSSGRRRRWKLCARASGVSRDGKQMRGGRWRLAPAACLGVLLFATPVLGPPPIRHDVEVDGHRLAVWQKRSAQPRAAMLLVHGRTWSSLPNFDLQVGAERSFMDALAATGLDVYAVDLRGYGATPRDATGWLTPARAVADVRAIIEWRRGPARSAGRQVYVLGLSRGAMVAALAAQRAPEKLAGVGRAGFSTAPRRRA